MIANTKQSMAYPKNFNTLNLTGAPCLSLLKVKASEIVSPTNKITIDATNSPGPPIYDACARECESEARINMSVIFSF
jgi:hypothetical protein